MDIVFILSLFHPVFKFTDIHVNFTSGLASHPYAVSLLPAHLVSPHTSNQSHKTKQTIWSPFSIYLIPPASGSNLDQEQ